jgi:twinkle protein
VAAHPAKMSRDRDGKTPTPGLYDISDSAHFANAADIGLVVHRANREINETEITLAKIRYQEIIGTPGVIKVQFLADQRRFQWIDQ